MKVTIYAWDVRCAVKYKRTLLPLTLLYKLSVDAFGDCDVIFNSTWPIVVAHLLTMYILVMVNT